MAWVDERINAPFGFTATDLPEGVRGDYLALHDFLRETMRASRSAEDLRLVVDDYGMIQTAAAPDAGDDRARRLTELGRIQSFFTEAQRNAERGAAIEDEDVDALDAADEAGNERNNDDAVDRAMWVVTDLYNADSAVGLEVRDAARGESFVDDNGAIKTELTDAEAQAFGEWATQLAADGGSARGDHNHIDGGWAEVLTSSYGVVIEDRY